MYKKYKSETTIEIARNMMRSAECRMVVVTCVIMSMFIYIITLHTEPGNTHHERSLQEQSKQLAERDGMIQLLTNKLACLTKGVLPSGGFCLDASKAFQGGNHVWDGKLCAGLESIFGHASVGDFGAGLGHYGSCFLRVGGSIIKTSNKEQMADMEKRYKDEMTKGGLMGKRQVVRSWEGFDSAFNIEEVSEGKIHTADLSIPFKLDHKFDWVMSLEVGEHIPKEKEDTFVDNLINHACVGIILSWAVEGQGGYNHINTRNNDYVVAKMKSKGLVYDEDTSKSLRKMVDVYWFKNTLMVYKFPSKKC